MFCRELIAASAKVQQLRDQVLALDMAYKGKQSLEQEIGIIRGQSLNILNQSAMYRRMSIQLANKILSECVHIGNKSRIQLSKQITQQLSELSTNLATNPPTPSSRSGNIAFAKFEDSDFDFVYPEIAQDNKNDYGSIWKSKDGQTERAGNQTMSFSMMFRDN